MLLKISSDFQLIEPNKSHEFSDFEPCMTKSDSRYIELKFDQSSNNERIVSQMINAMLTAQQADIPIIFVRSSDSYDKKKLPTNFCVGLFTSGTTGSPKLVFHQMRQLLPINTKRTGLTRWLLCYHPMSYAGLQVILQTIICGDVLITDVDSSIQEKTLLACRQNVTAICATPSYFRAMLMAWDQTIPPLTIISFGGEITDQATINATVAVFPQAAIRHIYATTETGVIFSVKDKLAGFSALWLGKELSGWRLSIANNCLQLSKNGKKVDTGDLVEWDQQRIHFIGRRDNVINVGGHKVNLEQLERSILELPAIDDARIFAKKNPITGYIIGVEIQAADQSAAAQALRHFSQDLEPAKRPRIIEFTAQIALNNVGKKQRH